MADLAHQQLNRHLWPKKNNMKHRKYWQWFNYFMKKKCSNGSRTQKQQGRARSNNIQKHLSDFPLRHSDVYESKNK